MTAFLAAAYKFLAFIVLLWEVYALWNHKIAFTFSNLTLFLWMPLVILFCFVLLIAPILILFAIAKNLF